MKKALLLSCCLGLACMAFAQDEKTVEESLKVAGGGTFGKAKILKDLDRIAIAQSTIYFKTATTREVYENERGAFGRRKQDGGAVAGTVTAYLDLTDGEMTENEYQELADGFYSYLVQKLADSKISAVPWDQISSHEFYTEDGQDVKDVTKDADAMKRKGQLYRQLNANKGNTLLKNSSTGGMNIGFAFGKMKRAGNYAKDLDAPLALLHLTVDFADIFLDGEVATGSGTEYQAGGMTKITKTKKWKMDAHVGANVKIAGNVGYSTLYNEKMASETMTLLRDLNSEVPFASSVQEDPNMEKLRARDNIFAKDFNMNPVVISTTKEKYKAAAKKALQNYADLFVLKIRYS
ncbi:MAG TPA: hypothetical protein VL092_13890 [Chitinophagaceae bacterium]|nr:hypothetical protein [Chitinophagaceae bacterium]